MGPRFRTVAVKQLPEAEKQERVSAFLEDFNGCLQVDRPRIVLNCSTARTLGRAALHLLLHCLEEAMKRNGDVRLSSVPAPALAVLETTGIDQLFRVYDNDADAVLSFQSRPVSAIPNRKSNGITTPFDMDKVQAQFEDAGESVCCGAEPGS